MLTKKMIFNRHNISDCFHKINYQMLTKNDIIFFKLNVCKFNKTEKTTEFRVDRSAPEFSFENVVGLALDFFWEKNMRVFFNRAPLARIGLLRFQDAWQRSRSTHQGWRCNQQERNLSVHIDRWRTQPFNPCVYGQPENQGVRASTGYMPDLQTTFRACANGSRPYHSLVRRRPDNRHKLSDALQGLQQAQEQQVGEYCYMSA